MTDVELLELAKEPALGCSTEPDLPPALLLLAPSGVPCPAPVSTEDWELGRRARGGLACLLAALVAVNFRCVGVDFLPPLTGDFTVARRISRPFVAMLPDDVSSSFTSSSSDTWGDMNRAVGRGPEVEGPLDFLRIGCGGGGLKEEDNMGSFAVDLSAAGFLGTSIAPRLISVCPSVC